MIAKLKGVVERLNKLVLEERQQLDKLKAENREFDATEKDAYEKRAADIDQLEAERESLVALESRDKRNRELQERLDSLHTEPERPGGGPDPAAQEQRAAFINYVKRGERRGLIVSDDSKGGLFAPKDFRNELLKGIVEITPVRQFARVVPTSKTAVQWPKRTGQFAAQWSGEEETQTESTGSAFGLEEIPTHKLRAMVEMSSEMLEDESFDLEGFMRDEAMEQFALAEGTGFVSGNGVKKPFGFAADAAITNTKSGTNGDFDADDLIDVIYDLPDLYLQNSVIFLSRKTLKKIRKLKANNEYIWTAADFKSNDITKGMAPTILGRPYVTSQQMQDTGTAGNVSVVVGDLKRGYIIADRVDISILRDVYTKAGDDVVRMWFRKRTGGQVVMAEAIRRLEESA